MGFKLSSFHITGVVDASDYPTLNAAVAALPAEGGTVIVPAGFTATIDPTSQVALGTKTVHIIGQCSRYTWSPRSIINLAGAPASNLSAFTGSSSRTWLILENLTFTASTTNSNWILVTTNTDNQIGLYMKNCYIKDYKIKKIHYIYYYSPGAIIKDVMAEIWGGGFEMGMNNTDVLFKYERVNVSFPSSPNSDAVGFYFRRNLSFLPITLNDCHVYRAGSDRGGFEFSQNSPPVIVSNCVADSCKGYGMWVRPGVSDVDWIHPVIIRDFTASRNSKHGIYIAGDSATKKVKADISNSHLINNGYDSPYNYDGICIGSYVDKISIRNCIAKSDGTRQRYACNFSSDTDVNIREYTGNNWTNGYRSGGAAEYWHPNINKDEIEIGHNLT